MYNLKTDVAFSFIVLCTHLLVLRHIYTIDKITLKTHDVFNYIPFENASCNYRA